MALIMNEINKQKRHIPIRQLIRRSASALVALKPCFMMGPLSVAQYLAPGQAVNMRGSGRRNQDITPLRIHRCRVRVSVVSDTRSRVYA